MSRALPARLLHVAALPFPSPQGTQAAIGSMLEHEARAGRKAQLLTYGGGLQTSQPGFDWYGAGRLRGPGALRSGPSLAKLALDARMLLDLRRLERRLRPEVIVAHHVEAAALSLSVARAPVVFFAHTDLAEELPTYAPKPAALALARAGGALDAALVRRAQAVCAISPSLRQRLDEWLCVAGERSFYVPTPWRVAEPVAAAERHERRRALGVPDDAELLLYAGNLDRYQGLELLLSAVAALGRRRPRLQLLVATESDSSKLRVQASAGGIAHRLRVAPLSGEGARRAAHAAADVAVVPRLSPGGLPMKLLDALARGVACVVVPRASAGLPLEHTVQLAARDDDAAALAEAIDAVLSSATHRAELRAAGPRYIAEAHCPAAFTSALDRAVAHALARSRR